MAASPTAIAALFQLATRMRFLLLDLVVLVRTRSEHNDVE
jgi:hypothetical protein